MSVECPTCGDAFDTEKGMKVHRTRMHGGRVETACGWCGGTFDLFPSVKEQSENNFCRPECRSSWQRVERVEVNCANCGADKSVLPSKNEKHERFFCDIECRNDWVSKNQNGENHPNWSQTSVECSWCDEEFKLPESRVKSAEHHFCPDSECYAKWQSENRRGDNHHQYDRVLVECTNCGEEEHRKPSRAEPHSYHFCSPECDLEWRRSEEYYGYKGGPKDYGFGWSKYKKQKVRIRDQARCQQCGCTEPQHRGEFGENLHVHHIMPARQIDDPEERNAMGNLITLCQNCHVEWEQIAPLRPDTNAATAD